MSIDDALPRNLAGAVVSLADRVDTLAGFFAIGAKPTGSKDPFGLRRAAQGVVQILLNRDVREVKIGIDTLIDLGSRRTATKPQPAAPRGPAGLPGRTRAHHPGRVGVAVRVRRDRRGHGVGVALSLTDLVDRIQAVKSVRDDSNFLSILDSAKRIANITAGTYLTRVDASRLEHATERRLSSWPRRDRPDRRDDRRRGTALRWSRSRPGAGAGDCSSRT